MLAIAVIVPGLPYIALNIVLPMMLVISVCIHLIRTSPDVRHSVAR